MRSDSPYYKPTYNTSVGTDKKGCSLPSLIFFFLVATVVTILSLVAFMIAGEYRNWETNTFTEIEEENFVDTAEILFTERREIEDKISEYTGSVEEVDSIEFTPREVGILIGDAVSESLPDWVALEAVYVEPYSGLWRVYFKTKMGDIDIPWISVRLVKDDIESAELFVSNVGLGDYDLEDIGLGFIADNVNDGYRDALLLINRSQITDREFENIELKSEGIIIKGRKTD